MCPTKTSDLNVLSQDCGITVELIQRGKDWQTGSRVFFLPKRVYSDGVKCSVRLKNQQSGRRGLQTSKSLFSKITNCKYRLLQTNDRSFRKHPSDQKTAPFRGRYRRRRSGRQRRSRDAQLKVQPTGGTVRVRKREEGKGSPRSRSRRKRHLVETPIASSDEGRRDGPRQIG